MIKDFFIYLIYVCFVVYGWTASLLGSVWPKISSDIGVDVTLIGILVMINYISSGLSSLFTYRIRMKLGTSYSNILGLSLAAIGMLVFANATSFVMVIVAIIFYGISSGIIDVNSNSYVVKAYDTKWVSFMHASWGLGATIGPMIMSFAIVYLNNYSVGFYISFAVIILIIVLMLFAKRYWNSKKKFLDKSYVDLHSVTKEEKEAGVGLIDILQVKNALKILFCFMLANGAGCSFSAWIATMAVEQRGATVAVGAIASSAFFFALMIGRVFFGMLADKVGITKTMLSCTVLTIIGIVIYYVPYKETIFIYANAALAGFASGAIIPLLNSNLKELFEDKYLSPLIGFGGVFGLVGIAIGSAVMTLVANVVGINNIQIVQVVSFSLLAIIYGSVVRSKAQN